ncbi:oligosaccharide flippase family protein [Bacillus timonensis]|nr:oligosaccharide flippase family protein [Bacillus timonensis]
MSKIKNEKKIGIILAYIFLVLSSILGVIITPVYINTIGADEFGLYQMVGSFASILLLLDFGMGVTSTRYITKYITENDERGKENFIAVAILLNVIFSLIIIFIALIIYNQFHIVFSSISEGRLELAKLLFLILIGNLVLSVFNNTYEGIINAYEKFTFNNSLKLTQIIIRTTIIIIMIEIYSTSMVIVIVDLLIAILLLIIRLLYCKLVLQTRAKIYNYKFSYYKEVFVFTFLIGLKAMSNYLNNSIDKYLIGMFVDTFAVTVYTIAMTIYGIFLTLPNTISSVYQPHMSKLIFSNTSKKDKTAFIVGTSRKQFIIAGYILFGFILTGKNFLNLWVGEDYMGAYYVCLILMIASIIHVCQSLFEISLYALNKHRFSAILNIILAFVNVLISIPLIKTFGYIGAPIGTAIVLIVGKTIIMSFYYKVTIGLDVTKIYYLIIKGTMGSLLLSAILTFFIANSIVNDLIALLVKGTLFTVIFVLSMFYYGSDQSERDFVKGFLRKVKLAK